MHQPHRVDRMQHKAVERAGIDYSAIRRRRFCACACVGSMPSVLLANCRPMWFDSFYVSMLSEKYKTGKQSVLKGGIMGSISNLNTLFHKEQCSSLIYVIGK